MLTITSFYAGCLALLLVALSVRVIVLRGKRGVSLGDGGDTGLQRAIRAHGNFAEYAPLGVILLALVEMSAAPGWAVHALGLLLLVGRLAHAAALALTSGNMPLRAGGILLTFAMLLLSGAGLLAHAVI